MLCLVAQSCQLFVIPWRVAHHVPLFMDILQTRIVEWIAMPSLRGSSQPRDQTQVSRIASRFFIFNTKKILYWGESHSVVSDSLWPQGLYSPWNSPGQNIGVGSHSLLQGIFPTQGSNPGLSHCRLILYQLNRKGSPRILEWVAYPFSRGSSWPRNWTGISYITGRFFTNWAIREALIGWDSNTN